jgi:hypothetical protein
LTGATGPTGSTGPFGSQTGVLSIKTGGGNFNFTLGSVVSTLPASFGTYAGPGAPPLNASTSFQITLDSHYAATNKLPIFNITGYIYNSSSGYVDVQRQFGAPSSFGYITVSADLGTLTISNITNGLFPGVNDNGGAGYALYIIFQVMN